MADIPSDNDEPIELSATEARGGSTTGVMRYVLLISMALVIVLFLLLFVPWH